MALVTSDVSRSKVVIPTLSLQVALAEFDTILNEDQRTQYHAQSSKLDTSAVISFVRTLDEASQCKARRGVSSRLCTFLDTLQQFTAIVDTFVNSNPSTAALVWGGVRVTLLTASNIAAYFDKVTSLIMTIGKFGPSYQKFGQLYPGCIDLQHALCNYYAVIVRLCMKIVTVSQRSLISQALNSVFSPFESDFSGYIGQLKEAAKLVELEFTLAADQNALERGKLAAVEKKENDKYRHLGRIFRTDVTKQQSEAREWRLLHTQREMSQLRAKIRGSLSAIYSLRSWKRVLQHRVPRTAEWFQQDTAFKNWLSDNDSAILWCTGNMGSGKTVLLSSMVEYLHVSRNPTDLVSHHFCLPDHATSLQTRQIFGSISRQLLDSWIQHAQYDELHTLYEAISDAESNEIVDILSARMRDDKLYRIVIDGIDECEEKELEALTRGLAKLYGNHPQNLKIVISSRLDIKKQLYRSLNIDYRMVLERSKIQPDVNIYIQTMLDHCLEDGKLSLTESALILTISETLERGAHGMFLWVHLFIQDLCELNSDNEIRKALESPSPSIAQLIDRKIGRIQTGQSARDIMKLLRYCGSAKRPLKICEFQELLTLEPDQQFLDPGQLLHDIGPVISKTDGLTYIDEEEDTVHYVHHHISSYLFDSLIHRQNGFLESDVDLHLGLLCMTYLNFNNFKTALSKPNSGQNTAVHPIDLGIVPISYSNNAAAKLAQKLLRSKANLQQVRKTDLEKNAQKIAGIASHPAEKLELRFHFLEYARTNWLDHLKHISLSSDNRIWNLFQSFASGENGFVCAPWYSEPDKQSGSRSCEQQNDHVVGWALTQKKPALLMHELKYNGGTIAVSTREEMIKESELAVLKNLMEAIAWNKYTSTQALDAAFVRAATYGVTDCIVLYLELHQGVCERIEPTVLGAALHAAVKGHHVDIVDKLLVAGADANALDNVTRERAAYVAAREGHLDLVNRLLAAGANSDGVFEAAIQAGQSHVIARFLTVKCFSNTAFRVAAEVGNLEIVEESIVAGVNVNHVFPDDDRTALQAAASRGHLKIVERLLEAGAYVNNVSVFDGRTALEEAAAAGHFDIVEKLLAAGARLDKPFSAHNTRTALQAAEDGGHLNIVETLKRAGARR